MNRFFFCEYEGFRFRSYTCSVNLSASMSSPQHLGQSHEEKNHTGRKFFLNKYGMKPFMCSMYGLGQQMSLSYLFICIISTDIYIYIRTYIHVYIYCIYFVQYIYIYIPLNIHI